MTEPTDTDVDLVDEFERLGRRAGEELRVQPPADGPGTIQRTAHRRRATVAALAAGVTIAVVVTGLFVATSGLEEDPVPVATVPEIQVPVPSAPTDPDPTTLDAVRTTTPGTWRAMADPLGVAPEFPAAAVWTGTEAIVIGSNWTDASEQSPPFAAAYDVAEDRWRTLAPPPSALSQETLEAIPPAMQWTGSEVLAATAQGAVYGYDPVQDRWETRAAADGESMALPAADALVAVSAHGVLARSSTGWWWYENSTDRWESVPALSGGDQYSTLAVLDQDRIIATHIDKATITSAVFEIPTRTWSRPVVADGPVSSREQPTCDANDGVLVCFAETLGGLDGVVIDPLTGLLDAFELGSHSNTLTIRGLPWMTHAWKLLSPQTATWEDLPPSPYDDVDSFAAAVWTGAEIIFFGGSHSTTGAHLGSTAAYTPLQPPGQ